MVYCNSVIREYSELAGIKIIITIGLVMTDICTANHCSMNLLKLRSWEFKKMKKCHVMVKNKNNSLTKPTVNSFKNIIQCSDSLFDKFPSLNITCFIVFALFSFTFIYFFFHKKTVTFFFVERVGLAEDLLFHFYTHLDHYESA